MKKVIPFIVIAAVVGGVFWLLNRKKSDPAWTAAQKAEAQRQWSLLDWSA